MSHLYQTKVSVRW